jgi:hypothetical protein
MLIFHSIIDLQKLCSTLANVSLCEMVEDEDRSSSSSRTTTTTATNNNSDEQSGQSSSVSSSSEFNSAIISGTSHLNESQKENRAP